MGAHQCCLRDTDTEPEAIDLHPAPHNVHHHRQHEGNDMDIASLPSDSQYVPELFFTPEFPMAVEEEKPPPPPIVRSIPKTGGEDVQAQLGSEADDRELISPSSGKETATAAAVAAAQQCVREGKQQQQVSSVLLPPPPQPSSASNPLAPNSDGEDSFRSDDPEEPSVQKILSAPPPLPTFQRKVEHRPIERKTVSRSTLHTERVPTQDSGSFRTMNVVSSATGEDDEVQETQQELSMMSKNDVA